MKKVISATITPLLQDGSLDKAGLKKIFEAQNKIIELEPVPKPDPKTFGSLGDALAAAKPL